MPISVPAQSFISLNLPPYLASKKNVRKFKPLLAKKGNLNDDLDRQQPVFPLKISRAFLDRSAVALFGLGFIDAGYSGDWSRIGVISKETEELLKVGAYLVTPLCLFLVFYVNKEEGSSK